jgi:hypothetical protein
VVQRLDLVTSRVVARIADLVTVAGNWILKLVWQNIGSRDVGSCIPFHTQSLIQVTSWSAPVFVTSVVNLSFLMADGKVPPVFQKEGNVSRSPMKDINQRAMELNRLRQVLEVVPYDPLALLNDT